MQDCPPVEDERLVVADAEEIEIGLVGERPGSVGVAHPHWHRRAVGDQLKALLALAQRFPCKRSVGDVDMSAYQPQRLAGGVALDAGLGRNPPDLTIIGSDDPILRRKPVRLATYRLGQALQGLFPVVRMNPPDPIFVSIIRIGRQTVDLPIFRRAKTVPEAVREIDDDTGNPRDLRNSDQFAFPLPQRPFGFHQRLVHTSEFCLTGDKGLLRLPAFGDVKSFAEDARDLAVFVDKRGVDEIEITSLFRRAERGPVAGFHSAGLERFPGPIDCIKVLEKAPVGQTWKCLSYRPAGPVMAAKQTAMGVVDKFNGMLRAAHHDDEPGRLLELPTLTLLFGLPLSFQMRPLGDFLANAE